MVIQNNGAIDACKELGAEGKVVGPSEAGASAQVPYIDTAITQHQNAILISANDPNALVPYLKKAMDQNIKVVTLDSDTAPAGRYVFINQASAEGIGQSFVQTFAKEIENSGDFAVLSATPNATNQNTGSSTCRRSLRNQNTRI
jgi:rhamnose transport system substrate-binding protein